MAEKSKKDNWDKTEVVVKVFGSLFIPVLVALLFYAWNQDRTKQLSMVAHVELAMEILQSPPLSDGSDRQLRQWAIAYIQSPADAEPFPDGDEILFSYISANAAICDATEELRTDLAQALLEDGGAKSRLAGVRLIGGMEAGCNFTGRE